MTAAPFQISNNLLDDHARLRARMADDGYLFFKGAVPKEAILAVRRAIVALFKEVGWVPRDAGDDETRWSGVGPYCEGQPEYMAVYKRLIHLPAFNAFAESAALVDLVGRVTGGEVQVHKLRIARVVFPHMADQTVAAHQDFFYIGGTPDTYTVWVPLIDCPPEMGGVAVLRGSHKHGFTKHVTIPGKIFAGNGLTDDMLPTENVAWHNSPFELGDVLMFHSHTIHQALPNQSATHFRLSTDNRYQRLGDAIAEHSLKKHYNL